MLNKNIVGIGAFLLGIVAAKSTASFNSNGTVTHHGVPIQNTTSSIVNKIWTWGQWHPWTRCDVTCGHGIQRRMRICKERSCKGLLNRDTMELRKCMKQPCRMGILPVPSTVDVKSTWGEWHPWTTCDVTCGPGVQRRMRVCISITCEEPLVLRRENIELRSCNEQPCQASASITVKTKSTWGEWQPWTRCDVTCGPGVQRRMRVCKASNCRELSVLSWDNMELRICNKQPCQTPTSAPTTVDTTSMTIWAQWDNWTTCDVTCGTGIQTKHRVCPTTGCKGVTSLSKKCQRRPCPGIWSVWQSWSTCTVMCGLGMQERGRTCSTIAQRCEGNQKESKSCFGQQCPGQWDDWQPWSKCSTSCGVGERNRYRTCSNWKLDNCVGNKTHVEDCIDNTECGIGQWKNWQSWSKCSTRCGDGERVRYRTCSNWRLNNCNGTYTESEKCRDRTECESVSASTNQWESWNLWSTCSQTCGLGSIRRVRKCDGSCDVGANIQTKFCEITKCKPMTISHFSNQWESWDLWSLCSQTCGLGSIRRFRKCDGKCDMGVYTETKVCQITKCKTMTRPKIQAAKLGNVGTSYHANGFSRTILLITLAFLATI